MTVGIYIEANFKQQTAKLTDRFFTAKAIKAAENAALLEAKNKAMSMYRKTTTTWNFPPQFTAIRTQGGYLIQVSDIRYRYLDKGTKVRYATMQPGFVAKTKVGVFYSYQGNGGVAYVNKRKKRPGIKARGWSEKIQVEVTRIIHKVYRERLHANWR